MPMPEKEILRKLVRENLDELIASLNETLKGRRLKKLKPIIARLGRGGNLPHWYNGLESRGILPNLDGKTIGSILEMIFVAILETTIFKSYGIQLKINPARGVDLPDLDLGVKSPSTNYCTSEPFFSAYERLYGNEYDCVVMLTDYQEAKKKPPLKLQIFKWKYLDGSEIADENLCSIARKHRDWLLEEGEALTQRVFRFLAYANQSDWRARQLLFMVDSLHESNDNLDELIERASFDYEKQNKIRESKSLPPLPENDITSLMAIKKISPRFVGVIDQIENWLTENLRDASRAPNYNEWNRLLKSPLNGKIGMSFALQWRYNFGRVFNGKEECKDGADLCY